jgi:hypothetical protein
MYSLFFSLVVYATGAKANKQNSGRKKPGVW